MIFKIYDPPDGKKTWNELCVGAIVDFISWECEKFFCGAGTFELVIPIDAKGVESLKLNRFLATYGGQFIIKQLNYTAENVKVSGYDLNGLLLDRLTVAQTDDGKDKQSGYTETIVKHYVGANCVNSTSTDRNYPGLVIAEDKQRGISNDAASPRLQCVADVISDILSAQQMGWRISVPNFDNSGAAKMSFDVFNSKDRTDFESQEYKHVAFSYGLGNTANIKAEKSIAGAKNTLYCELADGTVQTYSPIEDNVGYARTEEYADLNCELGEYTTYAEHEIADRFREADSVTLEHIDPTQFGTDFDIGDIVTVYDDKSKITKAALITAAKIKRSENEYDVTLTIGEARVKLLDRVSKSTKAVTTSVRENMGGGGDGTYTFNDAVVIQQGDAPYILHSYSVAEYLKNWLIVSPGPEASVIFNEHLAYSSDVSIDPSTAEKYSHISFLGAGSASATPIQYDIELQITESGYDKTYGSWNRVAFVVNGNQKTTTTTYGDFGLVIVFVTIYPPNDIYPNGYARINIKLAYKNQNGNMAYSSISTSYTLYYAGFKSLAEYHAAIRLSVEPVTSSEVSETTTTVTNKRR